MTGVIDESAQAAIQVVAGARQQVSGIEQIALAMRDEVLDLERAGMRVIQIDEPAADLAIAASIASSLRDLPVRADVVLIGEVGLSGELRWVSQMDARLREAAKLGFKTAIIPHRLRRTEPWPPGIQVSEARSLREAMNLALVGQNDAAQDYR